MHIELNDKKVLLFRTDCFSAFDKLIAEGIKPDLILADPPYGITCKNVDSERINLAYLWVQIHRMTSPTTPTLLFGRDPYSAILRSSSSHFKYDWIWIKNVSSNFRSAHNMPRINTEFIHVFYIKQPTFFPQGVRELNAH